MDQEDIKKMCVVASVSYYCINQMTNIQVAYLKFIEWQLAAIKPAKKKKKNPPVPRTLMYYERIVLRLSATTFRTHFRLTKQTFGNLCNLIGPRMAPNVDGTRGRPNTAIEKQILPVLWILATPESYRSVADRFDISKGTLYLFFNRLVAELNKIAPRYIRWPTPSEMPSIRRQFFKIAYFDDWVIGAVDGTYIVIPAPKLFPEVYRTRKSNFALTLQGICLPSMYFTSCFVGYPGSVSDRRVFENSPIYKDILQDKSRHFPTNEYIIGDKAYPILEWCQAPFIRRYVLNEAQETYNWLISATRQVIERAFALLFGRFRRLKMLDMHREDLIPNTVLACCVLHNLGISEKKL